MFRVTFLCFIVCLSPAFSVEWKHQLVETGFYAEGGCAGLVDGDGHLDLVYGPYWYKGPDFKTKHKIYKPKAFVANKGYSDNFFSYLHDINGDSKLDVIVFGFPGKQVKVFLNPGDKQYGNLWSAKTIAPELGHESPTFIDLIPEGLPEIVGSRGKAFGYYVAGENPLEEWIWVDVSSKGIAPGRFGHGFGVVDFDGDGRLDLIEKTRWFKHPKVKNGNWDMKPWTKKFVGRGGAQMVLDDVNQDGSLDLITSLNAHGYGLSWFELSGGQSIKEHAIMKETLEKSPSNVCFSQLHALSLADIDRDGDLDIVTGKRYLAHQGKDPGGLDAPVIYWFEKKPDGTYRPHLIDDNSGVGVEVKVIDINLDGKLDIISSNKKGLTIHIQK